jgi:maleylpyruvate isomerase
VTTDPAHDLLLVRESADQLVHDISLLRDDALEAPSLLPGWTRAHVIGHLIGNAEGLTRLLEWARSGEQVPQYPDQETKDAGISAALGQASGVLASRVRDAVDAFLAAAQALTEHDWAARVRLGVAAQGREITAGEVPWRRLVEQEVHNVDLAGAYTPAHWSQELVLRLLDETAEHYLRRPDVPALDLATLDSDWSAGCGDPAQRIRVEAPGPALLAWLTGRSSGEGLHHIEDLPALPAWF